MDNINKLKLPDDWAKDYESPVTLQIRKIAEQIEEQRENQITATISEQMAVNIDKDELKRALAYDRDQYRRGYEDGWRALSKDVPQWIPIKLRPGTDEEYEDFSQYGDCPREDFHIFDSPMPDDDQEVLITTRWGEVCIDIWHRDVDCCYFEDHCDDYDVIAWMPLPEPYKEKGEEE